MMILYFLIGFLAIVLVWFVWWFPKKQTSKYNFEPGKRWQVENELRKTLIQVFGGLVVIGSIFFAYQELRNFHISQENLKARQIASRFSQSIKFLGEDNTTQKIGGIYSVEQIARESPENYLGTVIEVLSAFVRNADVISEKMDFETWKTEIAPHEQKVKAWYDIFNKVYPKRTDEAIESEVNALKNFYNEWKEYNYEIKPETQIALTVLGRIRKEENKPYWVNLPQINLSKVKLTKISLSKANLQKAELIEANLIEANLNSADLQGADLWKANLQKAVFSVANLQEASLNEANLQGASFFLANLQGTDLQHANLQEASFFGANLHGAYLSFADLQGANLDGAKDLTTEQLLTVKTLYKVKGLPPEMEKKLRAKKPELFEKPILIIGQFAITDQR